MIKVMVMHDLYFSYVRMRSVHPDVYKILYVCASIQNDLFSYFGELACETQHSLTSQTLSKAREGLVQFLYLTGDALPTFSQRDKWLITTSLHNVRVIMWKQPSCTVTHVLTQLFVEMDLNSIVANSAKQQGYDTLKEKQIEAVTAFLNRHDTFFSLPTGYEKSLIYSILPLAFNKCRGNILYCNINHNNYTTRYFWEYSCLH